MTGQWLAEQASQPPEVPPPLIKAVGLQFGRIPETGDQSRISSGMRTQPCSRRPCWDSGLRANRVCGIPLKGGMPVASMRRRVERRENAARPGGEVVRADMGS